ncbi:MAG: hypothetical protein SOR72_06530 [Hornefia sp.]|nr:hypothetical protein [Hornefia sp.]
MRLKKFMKVLTLLLCLVMLASCFEKSEAFAKSRRVKKPTKINYKTIKIKAYQNSAKITFKKGKRASKYQVLYKAKNAKKWKYKVIKAKKKKVQTVTIKKLKKGTKYYLKIQGIKYKKVGKKWKKIRHRWRRVNRYKTVRGKSSKTISFKTKASQTSQGENTLTEKEFAEKCIKKDENVSLKYGDATIYLGQDWTEELKNQLNGSNATEIKKYTRPNYIEYYVIDGNEMGGSGIGVDNVFVDCTVYCYDTGDYDNFLRVNVVSGKIYGWETNGEILGTVDGADIKRGTVTDEYKERGSVAEIKKYDGTSKDWFGHLPEGATLIGGFEAKGTQDGTLYYGKYKDFAGINKIKENLASDEKMIGFHYINAIRKLAGSNPLEYNIFLDGGKETWKCTDEFIRDASRNDTPKLKVGEMTRYGGQATAETIYESIKAGQDFMYIKHSMKKCLKGPLAGQTGDEVGLAMDYASGKTIGNTGGNNGSGHTGETVASLYFDNIVDQKHTAQLLYNKHTQVGIGLAGDLHVEEFGSKF